MLPSVPAACVLFTAFEPSGDEHAAGAITALRRLRPDLPIHALGGPRMAEAGADLIENTTERAAMLGGAIAQARAHRRRLHRLRAWLRDHPVAVHVPTDSPAANWSICRLVKRTQSKIQNPKSKIHTVHLIAPQVWAWASWRVRRLVKWSDRVLCVLPFEPHWLAERGVEATFIGHPLFDRPLDTAALDRAAADFPPGRPRLALLPGSRPAEIRHNAPVMLEVLRRLRPRFASLQALVAVADEAAARRMGELLPDEGEHPGGAGAAGSPGSRSPGSRSPGLVVGQTDAALHWADAVLSVSGTATLHVARHATPMAVLYKANPLAWHAVGRWLIDTRTFALPNLIHAGRPHRDRSLHIVREFIPWLGGDTAPIADELTSLLEDEAKRDRQTDALRRVTARFAGHHAAETAAQIILDFMDP